MPSPDIRRLSLSQAVLLLGVALATASLVPSPAAAFCGFYVGGADASLYNDATMVVLVREGTRTVLSMQNAYEGPPEGFALVIPVPEVLQEENVQTLPADVFARVDRLAAPRLVEYWEHDPCAPPPPQRMFNRSAARPGASVMESSTGVTVEAEFAVGEYDIVILSAAESDGLERWLRQENYNIPAGASEVLAPYVQLGTKFFVAKVDPARVTFANGRAVLSPLRFYYDDERLALPIRLGLLNSRGQQDLIVHILARGTRYEAANHPNVTIPTNLVVAQSVRENFGAFYRALFDRVAEQNPGAVVTEYSWLAMNCDPCPDTPLQAHELNLLGADVMGSGGNASGAAPSAPPRFGGQGGQGWTLTRLHHRYGPEGLNRDLVFREAPPIVGGRGMPDADGKLQEQLAAQESTINNFQGRYVMLNRWEGPAACQNPRRGIWGGPNGRTAPGAPTSPPPSLGPRSTASIDLGQAVQADDQRFLSVSATPAAEPNVGLLPGVDEHAPAPGGQDPVPQPAPQARPVEPGGGCASCTVARARQGGASAFFALLFLALVVWRRR